MNQEVTTTDDYLASLPDWQRQNLELFRHMVHDELPGVTEQIKWGVPTFIAASKIVFAMSAFKAHTKYNFILNGASLRDQYELFNNGLDSSKSRAIDLKEGESVDHEQLKALIEAAVAALQ